MVSFEVMRKARELEYHLALRKDIEMVIKMELGSVVH